MTQLPYDRYPREPLVLENLSLKYMRQAKFVPLSMREGILEIAIADIRDHTTIESLELAYHCQVQAVYGQAEDILEAIERLYGIHSQSIDNIIEEADRDISEIVTEVEENESRLRDLAQEAPIIRLVNRIIGQAVEEKASDIHFEPFEYTFRVRYRLDGLLREVESPPSRLQAAIISRIKIMAKLDISERRRPQDGRIKLKVDGREIDFRVSTIPTHHGESLVMRILDRESLILDLAQIGFPERLQEEYDKVIHQPYGMILVTGPTGSGKTSTLYTTLDKINLPSYKIMTMEDPIEYQLAGINQIQVNPKIGFTFAGGLRSIVRQDPDIILIGEIRDKETAEIAIQSALTGHLLFSTLHTNDAPGAITRLLEMGVENYLLSSTLLAVLAQRLVRLICPFCKEPTEPDPKLLKTMPFSAEEIADMTFYHGSGCEECRHTGYKGRTAIFEYLPVDEAIRKEIDRKSSTEKIKETALARGMVTLLQDGWRMVREGRTTVSEVLRVTLAS
ncbi:MAG: type II secretion system ATPase GspE [Proteobacteria bacterium]|nr:type II secretion system ATPase GspE [Pseudomonadota bacterium]MBU1715174.1 type II secretion system ATPase GspE [Pseudomonadota bacterium]